MRPGHIRVFDGLRITTEHINHLQGSFHSALQEIREILGVGRVCYGFEVTREGDDAITVQPGLAFDFENNRIACDEPRTLQVTFEPGQDTKFVCIKYDQIEDGQIEGHFTLVWDSCSVVLHPTPPTVEENLVPIARLTTANAEAGEGFKVISLLHDDETPEPEESTGAEAGPGEPQPEPGAEAAPAEPARAESDANPARTAEPGAGTVGSGVSGAAVEAEPAAPEEEAKLAAASQPEAVEPPLKVAGLKVSQGVERLTSGEDGKSYLGPLLIEPLKKKLSGDAAESTELLFLLSEKEVPLDYEAASLGCHVIMKAVVAAKADATPEPGQPQYTDAICQSTSRAEVTFAGDEVSQFGLSTIDAHGGAYGYQPWSSGLTERGIAYLPVKLKLPDSGGSVANAAPQPTLQLLARVARREGAGFMLLCNLTWKGIVTEEFIREVEAQNPSITWEILLAWKAFGESWE